MKSSEVFLEDVCSFLSGFAWSASSFNSDKNGMPIIRIQNVDAVRESDFVYWGGEYDERFIIKEGDLLLTLSGSFRVVCWSGQEALLNQRIVKLTPHESVDRGWFLFILRSKLLEITGLGRHALVSNVALSDLRKISISLPPLPEQRRIAAILDHADQLRVKRREALAELDRLTQSIFVEMFGDAVSNPMGWNCSELGSLIDIGPQNGIYKHVSDYGSGTRILRIDAFYDGVVTKIDTLKRVRLSESEKDLYSLLEDDIVINRVNSMEYLGKSAIIPNLKEHLVFESNMMKFRVKRDVLNPKYLVHFLQTKQIKNQIAVAAKHAVNQSSINQQDVKSFKINIPPLSLQEKFVERVECLSVLKEKLNNSLTDLNNLFTSLQHRAFRGDL